MKTTLILCFALVLCYLFTSAQNPLETSLTNNTNNQIDEGEAHIAINPADSTQMAVGFMVVDNGDVRFKIFYSSNGGNSWQESALDIGEVPSVEFPVHSVVGGGDIVLAYDNEGELYCTWIHFLCDFTQPNPYDTCIMAGYWAKSLDNGAHFAIEDDHFWGLGKINLNGGISVHDYADGICDRQWLAVDRTNGPHANNIYVGYTNYPFQLANTGLRVRTKGNGQAGFSSTAADAFLGNAHLTNLAVDNSGTVHYVFCDIPNEQVMHASSSDGAQTFSEAHLIGTGIRLYPENNFFINDREDAGPSLAVDGNDNLHVVWNDFPVNAFPIGHYSRSTDGGETWSSPIDLKTVFPGEVFMPAVSAYGNRVSVTAYVLDSNKASEFYHATSFDYGATFGPPVKVSSGVTDFAAVGQAAFVGDYTSTLRTACAVFSLWTDCRTGACVQYLAKYDECQALGVAEFSPIVSSFNILEMHPVPTRDVLTIRMRSDEQEEVSLHIYDLNGREMYQSMVMLRRDGQEVRVNLSELASGSYLLKAENTSGTFQTRLFTKQP